RSLRTRETVAIETPARLAMSRMVARAARVPEAVSVIEASVGHRSGRVKAAKSLTLLTRSVNRYRNNFRERPGRGTHEPASSTLCRSYSALLRGLTPRRKRDHAGQDAHRRRAR